MKPARGVKGCIIDSFDGNYYFRVYNADHTFVDYHLRHCDLQVIIDDDDAVLYDDELGQRLDHSPATLGQLTVTCLDAPFYQDENGEPVEISPHNKDK